VGTVESGHKTIIDLKRTKHDKDKQVIAAYITQTIASLNLFLQKIKLKNMKKRKQVMQK